MKFKSASLHSQWAVNLALQVLSILSDKEKSSSMAFEQNYLSNSRRKQNNFDHLLI